MTLSLHDAVYCIPADAIRPLSIPCSRHRAAIGERCGDSFCDTRYREAKRLLVDERVREAKGC